jgi:hypothetical protein
MTLPAQIAVSFDFTSGATFGYPFTIGDPEYGQLGVGTLASTTTPEPTVDLTPNVRQISYQARSQHHARYLRGWVGNSQSYRSRRLV